MKRFLAIGSSQLAGFRKGVDRFDESLAGRFHFAGMWEPGFGYLNLESDGSICAQIWCHQEIILKNEI